MNLQPIIRVVLAKYKENYELSRCSDSEAFERLANQTILTSHQPDAFSVSDSLLDSVCVGGTNDMGLDGICIKLNGLLIHTLQEARDIIERYKKAEIEFIFIQSKYKEKFDSGEYSKFTNGVIDFLGTDHFQPRNPNIDQWNEIKDYLLSDNVMRFWKIAPIVRLYYIVMGVWEDSPHIIAISNKCEKDLQALNLFEEVSIQYVDAAAFRRIFEENENALSVVLNVMDTFSLTPVEEVDNSSIILLSAKELMKLFVSKENVIRHNLFNDNVRDYQGNTTINQDILETIQKNPYSFVLLNNGITIVCNKIMHGNRKVTIENPQIVNGCQTCNAIYHADRHGLDLSNVSIIAKVIATENSELTNRIVKGTNRQNIVYDEAFEMTRTFHKDLEDFFNALVEENRIRLFYERRSKQYSNNPSIKPFEKINLRGVIQSFVSIFLERPYEGHRHESKLLQKYRNTIFLDRQSKYPYYISALIYIKVDQAYRRGAIQRELLPYKMHLCWMIKNLSCSGSPSINDEKRIDEYCKEVQKGILDDCNWRRIVQKVCHDFLEIQNRWIIQKGDSYKYGMKDSTEFFQFLTKEMHFDVNEQCRSEEQLQCRGVVIKTGVDRYGKWYGFISRSPDNVFFHEGDNPNLQFATLRGRDVLYSIKKDKVTRSEKAIDIRLL